MHEDFSVLVIAHGRAGHLQRLLDGVNRSSRRPVEVVVVYMDDHNPTPVLSRIPVRAVHVSSQDPGSGLPLARARNTAVRAATTELLVFLDVDCIPSSGAFEAMLQPLAVEELLMVMPEPRFLREPLPEGLKVNDQLLLELSVTHQARAMLPRGERTDHHELFWSLAFALRRQDFTRTGGFDERYVGYGAEDTDFAFRAREAGLQVYFVEAPVFHQHHPLYKPPLNHFTTIVCNARRFFDCWGRWPMTPWLDSFAQRELIGWDERGQTLEVLRQPSPREVEAARRDDPY